MRWLWRRKHSFLRSNYFDALNLGLAHYNTLVDACFRLQEDPPAGVSGAPSENNIMVWNAVIFGWVTSFSTMRADVEMFGALFLCWYLISAWFGLSAQRERLLKMVSHFLFPTLKTHELFYLIVLPKNRLTEGFKYFHIDYNISCACLHFSVIETNITFSNMIILIFFIYFFAFRNLQTYYWIHRRISK